MCRLWIWYMYGTHDGYRYEKYEVIKMDFIYGFLCCGFIAGVLLLRYLYKIVSSFR